MGVWFRLWPISRCAAQQWGRATADSYTHSGCQPYSHEDRHAGRTHADENSHPNRTYADENSHAVATYFYQDPCSNPTWPNPHTGRLNPG